MLGTELVSKNSQLSRAFDKLNQKHKFTPAQQKWLDIIRSYMPVSYTHLQIEVREGDLLHGTEGKADVIIANIIADIVIMLLQDIPQKLNDNGVLLASGIIEERMPDVEAAAQAQGLYVDVVDHRGGWVVMQMKKK